MQTTYGNSTPNYILLCLLNRRQWMSNIFLYEPKRRVIDSFNAKRWDNCLSSFRGKGVNILSYHHLVQSSLLAKLNISHNVVQHTITFKRDTRRITTLNVLNDITTLKQKKTVFKNGKFAIIIIKIMFVNMKQCIIFVKQ